MHEKCLFVFNISSFFSGKITVHITTLFFIRSLVVGQEPFCLLSDDVFVGATVYRNLEFTNKNVRGHYRSAKYFTGQFSLETVTKKYFASEVDSR